MRFLSLLMGLRQFFTAVHVANIITFLKLLIYKNTSVRDPETISVFKIEEVDACD